MSLFDVIKYGNTDLRNMMDLAELPIWVILEYYKKVLEFDPYLKWYSYNVNTDIPYRKIAVRCSSLSFSYQSLPNTYLMPTTAEDIEKKQEKMKAAFLQTLLEYVEDPQ